MGPHVLTVIGRGGTDAWLDDRGAAPIRISMDELARARAGYKKGKHRLTTMVADQNFDLESELLAAIRYTTGLVDRAEQFLEISQKWAELSRVISTCGDKSVTRGCEISDARAELVDAKGGSAAPEMQVLWTERKELASTCQLSASQSRELFQELGAIVSEIASLESAAIRDLKGVVR